MPTVPFNFTRETRGMEYPVVRAPDVAGAVAAGAEAMGRAVGNAGDLAGRMALQRLDEHRRQIVAADMTRGEAEFRRAERDLESRLPTITDPADLDAAMQDAVGSLANVRDSLRYNETKLAWDSNLVLFRERLRDRVQARRMTLERDGANADAETAIASGVETADREMVTEGVQRKAYALGWTPEQAKQYREEKLQALSLTAARTQVRQYGNQTFETQEGVDHYAAQLRDRLNDSADPEFQHLTPEQRAETVATLDQLADGLKRDQTTARDKALAKQADAVGANLERFAQAARRNDFPEMVRMRVQLMQDIADAERAEAVGSTKAQQWRGMIEADTATVDDQGSLRGVRAVQFGWQLGRITDDQAQSALTRYFDGGPRTAETARDVYLEIEQKARTGKGKEQSVAVKAGREAIELYSGTGLLGNRRMVVDGTGDKAKVRDVTDDLRRAEQAAAEAVALRGMRNRTESEQRKIMAQTRAALAAKLERQDAAYNRLHDEFQSWASKNPNASATDARQWVRDMVGTAPFAALAQVAMQAWDVELPRPVTVEEQRETLEATRRPSLEYDQKYLP